MLKNNMVQNRHGIDKIIIRSHDDDDADEEEEGGKNLHQIHRFHRLRKKICEILQFCLLFFLADLMRSL